MNEFMNTTEKQLERAIEIIMDEWGYTRERTISWLNELIGESADLSPWQPIATMPKDGTRVLVCVPGMVRPDVAWHDEAEPAEGAVEKAYTLWAPMPTPPK